MTSITVEIRNAVDSPWPERGHHVRITSEDEEGRKSSTVDVPVDVGTNRFEVPAGFQILRLFHTEGTWEEKQVGPDIVDPTVAFHLPEPEYGFVRASRLDVVRGVSPEDAWRLFAAHSDNPGIPAGGLSRGGLDIAIASEGPTVTAFMLPSTAADAVPDIRVYPAAPEIRRTPRIRMRWDHPEVGMAMTYVAMNQMQSAAPQVDRLIAEDARRFARGGDVAAALTVAHAVADRHGVEAQVEAMLGDLAKDLPQVSDVSFLRAYRMVMRGDYDGATALTRLGISQGPPALTLTVKTLQLLTMHLEDVPEIAAVRRICSQVDPGCLLTSVRLTS